MIGGLKFLNFLEISDDLNLDDLILIHTLSILFIGSEPLPASTKESSNSILNSSNFWFETLFKISTPFFLSVFLEADRSSRVWMLKFGLSKLCCLRVLSKIAIINLSHLRDL